MKHLLVHRILLSLLIMYLVLVSCDKQNTSEYRVIDIVSNLNNTREIMLSDIADEIQYIPLETNSEYLISKGHTIVTTKDLFFIADGEKPLFVFDRKGNFVRKIGTVGKGPGEFQNCNHFHVNEEMREIYVFNQIGFIIYSWDGEYISTVNIPFGAMSYHASSQGDFAFFYTMMGRYSTTNRVFFTDSDLKLKGDISWEQKANTGYSLNVGTQVWNWNDKILAQIEFCDTIYTINEKEISPKVYLDFGDIRFTTDMLAVTDAMSLMKSIDNHVFEYGLSTLDDIWAIKFTQKQTTYLGFLNPDNQEVVFASRIDTSMGGLINDIDGGPGYFPYKRFKEDQWITAISAIDFCYLYQNGQFENADVIDPDANKLLNETAATVDENDNPILMLLKKKTIPTLLDGAY